jgi:hypothetical protein
MMDELIIQFSTYPFGLIILLIVIIFMIKDERERREAVRRDVFIVGKVDYKGNITWKDEPCLK